MSTRLSPPSRTPRSLPCLPREEVEDREVEDREDREGREGLASPDLISRVHNRPPRQSRKSPGKTANSFIRE